MDEVEFERFDRALSFREGEESRFGYVAQVVPESEWGPTLVVVLWDDGEAEWRFPHTLGLWERTKGSNKNDHRR